ncbi:hypothetical protein [Dyadobacter sp. NIV53]|uniref:hypothetical protein n=1 Tax=Dyadobacter sp. NIV53 TaxID=2861765 RepID=UPI001C876EAD|nr:hypothetical protein [Dyadobacter sp. NIV53]
MTIPLYILFSNEMTEYRSYPDEFEGTGYLRILLPFKLENGEIGAGNIYALNQYEAENGGIAEKPLECV